MVWLACHISKARKGYSSIEMEGHTSNRYGWMQTKPAYKGAILKEGDRDADSEFLLAEYIDEESVGRKRPSAR